MMVLLKSCSCATERTVPVVHHKLIVANRLHLQVIVEGGNFEQVVKALARYHRAEQLTRFTGAAHQQSFPVADQLAFGNQRDAF